jgi:thymidylate kinase
MIIEFIGSTGAGKTTLISHLKKRLARRAEVATAFDLVAASVGLQAVANPTAQNLIQELIAFPFFIRSLLRHKAFVIFALKMLARQGKFTFFTLNNLRSLERKLGVYEMIRKYKHDQIILVDEGTILLAHNLFVYTDTHYNSEEIDQFATMVPLPDIVVYIKVPVDHLIQRTLQRTDPPREIKSKDRTLIEQYINRAVTMFDYLVGTDNIRNRALIIENPEATDKRYDSVVNRINEFLLNYKLSDE